RRAEDLRFGQRVFVDKALLAPEGNWMGIGTNALLEIRGLAKSFPGVKALQGVDFTVRRGEVHGLMGENGAGKSTLIKVLTGVYPRDGGTIRLDGVEIEPRSPKVVEGLGVS